MEITLLRAMVLFLLFASQTVLAASKPSGITDAEMALLPKYCAYTQGMKNGIAVGRVSAEGGRWLNVIGPGFWHLHHYCWALIQIQRAASANATPADRKSLRLDATNNLQYVLDHVPGDLVLLPEILTWMGRLQLQSGNPYKAHEAFSAARQAKPDYWPAYFHWAEYLSNHNQKAEAKRILQLGLQETPNATPLRLLYRDLGGNPADIAVKRPAPSDQQPQRNKGVGETDANDASAANRPTSSDQAGSGSKE